MTDTTLLVISAIGVPPYSARGLTQTLQPIPASQQMRRTVNGALTDVSASQYRKYLSTITCTDQQAPALDGIWPGMQVVVDCVAELVYPTAGGSPERTLADGTTTDEATRVEGEFTFYRPKLTMMVTGFRMTKDEYEASVGWTLELEEV